MGNLHPGFRQFRVHVWTALSFCLFSALAFSQPQRLVSRPIDPLRTQILPNQHPLWANASNDQGPLPPDQPIQALTLVLNRTPEQAAAFQNFLAEQQNPASSNYHLWLTPAEVGKRFGPSMQDVSALTGWLASQGLHVDWIAPSHAFIGFSGIADNLNRALGTQFHAYRVNGQARISIASDPLIPAAVIPAVSAIHGLYTIAEEPQYSAFATSLDAPQMTTSTGTHYMVPGDFATIYNLPANLTGAGQTIGIVGRARTNFADFDNFNNIVGPGFAHPTEIVPTAFGGVDPGPPYTSPPPQGTFIGDQAEATLDVIRAGSVAPQANLLLVVSTAASGGLATAAQFLVNTSPVPAQIINISFGACELKAGPAATRFWDTLFQQAAAEGISSFVSSGDSGAAGCDAAFAAPPSSPLANSPNYICSSSYATCVGGTQFADPVASQYWSVNPGYAGPSAIGYIPEGGWNESGTGSASTVAASEGGTSQYIATPSWQQGIPGVPSSNAGRYTPDISFASSFHDGYFLCFAAGGGSCAVSDGRLYFSIFEGTSAATPGMAGIAALLNQNSGSAQGNLNPGIYRMSISTPRAFHDITVASSGLASCDLNVPSVCNNSIPGLGGLDTVQPGFLVNDGYDQVTGLGSLDASSFIFAWPAGISPANLSVAKAVPTVDISPAVFSLQATDTLNVRVMVSGGSGAPAPTGNVQLTAPGYSTEQVSVSATGNSFTIPAGALVSGTPTLTATYSGDANYSSASGSAKISVAIPPGAAFVLEATGLTIARGVTGGNNSTITLTPTHGFAGPVNLSAFISSSPGGAANLPTFSFTPAAAANLLGSTPVTLHLAVSTMNLTSRNAMPTTLRGVAGGAALTVLIFLTPISLHRGSRYLTLLLLLIVALGSTVSCGGGRLTSAATNSSSSGTTPGLYTVTITATSGTLATSKTINLTVQ